MRQTMKNGFSVYMAGDIFDHKHLIGNAVLADYIQRVSQNRYFCILPQNKEQGENRKVEIRNQDLRKIMEADLGLFNFDGADLDSGTVVEFIVAKQLDIPAVLFRSDFRNAGDQNSDGDNWNLMCSNFPRTETLRVNSMGMYKKAESGDLQQTIDSLYTTLAQKVIRALDKARKQTPISSTREVMTNVYRWTTQFCGGGMEGLLDDPDWLRNILERKRKKGLIG